MRLLTLVTVGAFGVLLALDNAGAQGVRLSPTSPTTSDSLRVTAYSGFSRTGCWQVGDAFCGFDQPDTLTITVPIGYCNGLPSCRCSDVLMTYQRACTVGPLPAGTYVAKFTEQHTSSYDPEATFTRTMQFTVSGTTPAQGRTWGALKSIYR